MTQPSKKTVKQRLMLFSGVMIANLAVLGFMYHNNIEALTKDAYDNAEVMVPAARHISLIDMYHDGLRGAVIQASTLSPGELSEEAKGLVAEVSEFKKKSEQSFTTVALLKFDPELLKKIALAGKEFESYVALGSETLNLHFAGETKKSAEKQAEFLKQFEVLEKLLGDLGDQVSDVSKAAAEKIHVDGHWALVSKWANLVLAFLINIIGSFWVIRSLQKDLVTSVGDLTIGAEHINENAQTLLKASSELADSSNQSSAAVQETASALDEITAMIRKSEENASTLKQSSEQNQQSADSGKQAIQQMVQSVGSIQESNERILNQIETGNQRMADISKLISEIGNKTKVINDIVFQTKLLSFNASVEAARAGEHGKGFAVVAEEVGNLAQMSGNAAKEISDLLSHSVGQVNQIIDENRKNIEKLMNDSKSKLEEGIQTAQRCEGSLHEIGSQAVEVAALVGEITTAINEQSRGIQEISKAIGQIDSATQRNSTTALKTTESANGLFQDSQKIKGIVTDLNQLITQKAPHSNSEQQPTAQQKSTKETEKSSLADLESNAA